MFAYLAGQITARTERSIWLEVRGIGYDIQMTATSIARLEPSEKQIRIYTHLIWKEDDIQLYGFEDAFTKEIFLALISVSGIGPRIALSILSFLEPEQAIACISSEDTAKLQKIPGIGKKMAARICVDLKDKAKKILGRISQTSLHEATLLPAQTVSVHRMQFDAVSALVNLGYSEANASEAVKKASDKIVKSDSDGKQLENLIKIALQELNKF